MFFNDFNFRISLKKEMVASNLYWAETANLKIK
jgi:hypothetical protein